MITINISEEEIAEAKAVTKKFDEQKTYNKFVCNTNYRGYLGELMLHKYLTSKNIKHEWVTFIKQGTNSADFIINGKTIDLKCTVSDKLWYNSTPHDVYIYAQISKDDKVMTIKSWMPKEELKNAKTNGKSNKTIFYGNVRYTICPDNMYDIESLLLVQ